MVCFSSISTACPILSSIGVAGREEAASPVRASKQGLSKDADPEAELADDAEDEVEFRGTAASEWGEKAAVVEVETVVLSEFKIGSRPESEEKLLDAAEEAEAEDEDRAEEEEKEMARGRDLTICRKASSSHTEVPGCFLATT